MADEAKAPHGEALVGDLEAAQSALESECKSFVEGHGSAESVGAAWDAFSAAAASAPGRCFEVQVNTRSGVQGEATVLRRLGGLYGRCAPAFGRMRLDLSCECTSGPRGRAAGRVRGAWRVRACGASTTGCVDVSGTAP